MSFLDDVNNKIQLYLHLDPNKSQEQVLIEALSTLDYTNTNLRKEIDEYVYDWMERKIPNNELPPNNTLIAMFYMLAKSSLAEQGLENITVHVRERKENEDAGAFYNDNDKSITLFSNTFKAPDFQLPIKFHRQHEKFAYHLYKIEHEIRHAVQWKVFDETNKGDIQLITPDNYLMQKQDLARVLKNIYSNENWGNFRFEIDADYVGSKRALERVKTLAPSYYKYADENEYVKYVNLKRKQDMERVGSLTWKHSTNVNNKDVQADHKASLIADRLLMQIRAFDREKFLEQYPILKLTHNSNGTKKSLDQVEQEREEKLREILGNKNEQEIEKQATRVEKLYDAIIESDPVLSLEYQLRHIANLTYGSNRYFTENGQEVKYSSSHIRKELEEASNKCKDIATYIEAVDTKITDQLINKYTKIAQGTKFNSSYGYHFKNEKLSILKDIQQEINQNQAIYAVHEQDRIQAEKIAKSKKMNIDKALEILKAVFPDFTPSKSYNLSTNEEGYFSREEKALLLKSYKQYSRDLMKTQDKGKGFVTGSQVLGAINILYPFELSADDDQKYEKLNALPNIYTDNKSSSDDLRSRELKPSNGTPLFTKNQQKAKEILKQAFPNFSPIDYNAQEKMMLQRSIMMLHNHMIENDIQTWHNDYTIQHLADAVNILFPVETTEEQQNNFDKQWFNGEIKLERHLYQEDESEEAKEVNKKQEQMKKEEKIHNYERELHH